MTETMTDGTQSPADGSPDSQRAGSFLAVSAAILVGLSVLAGITLLLARLMGNPPA